MGSTKDSYKVAALIDQHEKTGLYLINEKVVLYSIPFNENKEGNTLSLSWKNEKTSFATGDDILKIEQYLEIYRNRQFHFLLFDGSLIRFSFCFEKNKLISENLLWWPCPIRNFHVDNLFEIEALLDSLNGTLFKQNLYMRSPIRLDYDSSRDEENHPLYHFHLENPDTRIGLNRPLCINGFMRFILQNFYPLLPLNYSTWKYIDFKTQIKRHGERDFFEIGSCKNIE